MISNKEKYSIYKPKKFLGQNFLVDENIARKIVASLGIMENDFVLEIGPGQGVLTKYISELTENFTAVEIDKSIYEKLSSEFGDKVKIIHKDFLKTEFNEELFTKSFDKRKDRIKVIGNIPYNITTEILFRLFDNREIIDTALLMMQKEVGKRLTAKPDTKDYGILAVQTQANSKPEILFGVAATAFFPKPNVDSVMVKFNFNEICFDIKNKEVFKTLVRQSFGQRRKTMRNSLKKYYEQNGIDYDKTGFDYSRRPENVSIKEFAELSEKISEMIKLT